MTLSSPQIVYIKHINVDIYSLRSNHWVQLSLHRPKNQVIKNKKTEVWPTLQGFWSQERNIIQCHKTCHCAAHSSFIQYTAAAAGFNHCLLLFYRPSCWSELFWFWARSLWCWRFTAPKTESHGWEDDLISNSQWGQNYTHQWVGFKQELDGWVYLN